VLATRFGVFAADLLHEGAYGRMASLDGVEIVAVPLESAVTELKTVPQELYDLAATFFG
jgi:6-phosphofructokinase 1